MSIRSTIYIKAGGRSPMFKKSTASPGGTDTLIGEESILEGNVRSRASLRVEGKVHGDIHCEGDVTVGKNGAILSNVRARKVYNAGIIEGAVQSDALVIHASGEVNGNIHVGSLTIAEGGIFQGSSKMVAHTVNETNVHQLDKKKKKKAEQKAEGSGS